MSSLAESNMFEDVLCPLQGPPSVLIPGKHIPRPAKMVRSATSSSIVTSSSSVPVTPVDESIGDEKVGRWSDEEHKIFLEGLEKHGKQWKTISTMIGTRTVVQVRTHAQKYFQKLDRKNKKVPASVAVTTPSIAATAPAATSSVTLPTKMSKRKSLPTSLPSRKKSKILPPQDLPTRAASMSLDISSSLCPSSDISSPFVSTSSFSSENWSTFSPTGVIDLDLQLQNSPILTAAKEPLFLVEDPLSGNQSDVPLCKDPLDWLIDDGGAFGHLPESSLEPSSEQAPMFPDFSELSSDDYLLEVRDDATSYPLLQDIPAPADPRVTVQSLFIEDGDAHLP